MPVYEYHCNSCNRDFEYQQRMSDPEKDTCEACGGSLERLISRTAFALKGGGWYKDLYSSTRPESAKSDNSSDGSSAASAPAAPAAAAPSSAPSSSTGSSTGGSSGSGASSGSSSGGSSSSGASSS